MTGRLAFFAPCPKGVEPLLADELRRLKLPGVRPQRSGVLFSGGVPEGLRALYWTRLATRVLLTLGEVDARSADVLYAGVADMPWEEHLRASGTIAVDASGVNDALRNTQFTAVRVKDAIADRFRERFSVRPSVDTRSPDVRVNVAVRANKATVSVDLAGTPLHRRGYREPGVQVAAPMKETLAAALLDFASWREIAEAGGSFVDPMCGSGTLAIEAALMAGDVAPGLVRGEHAVERWLGFDADAWRRIGEQARRRRDAGLARLPLIVASDSDPRAVDIARRCAKRAGLEYHVNIEHAAVEKLRVPHDAVPGLVATNPPWGERLSERSELPALYRVLGEGLRASFVGWRLAVASPDPALPRGLGMRPLSSAELGSGKGAATVTTFDVGADLVAHAGSGRALPVAGGEEFANRLRKMSKHVGKWARRTGVSCYRVYDADLPDFAIAVDVYEGAGPSAGERWIHVAEYAAPAEVDADLASARLDAAVEAIATEFGVERDSIFVKRRARQRGSAQYERLERRGATGVVAENGLLFEVNLSDYLDTGLFLDHRDTRAWLREMASGKRFLNLYAYTGTATAYAAAGGAASSVTVDLSQTYLDWARRNLELNGISTERHTSARSDTFAWLEEARASGTTFDLVFCDPPTFSSSKAVEGTFDVQRDHVRLILAIGEVLADGGTLVFSCNRRRFRLDEEALAAAGLAARDVTARTIPKDFERTPWVHACWTIARTAGS